MTVMNHDNNKGHFFASSVADWITTTPDRSLSFILQYMENANYPFNLFYVPAPWDSNYEINFYQPQVEGTQWLGYFKGDEE